MNTDFTTKLYNPIGVEVSSLLTILIVDYNESKRNNRITGDKGGQGRNHLGTLADFPNNPNEGEVCSRNHHLYYWNETAWKQLDN